LSVVRYTRAYPFILLGIALFIALGFEFVNGFHDTANAVATVIYTHSLPPNFAVVWSGTFNFLGVLVSSGAVAFGIVSLLPVELILQVGSGAGFAMVFALLLAAILWNLGTWYFGLPASSSHTLIGSIMGVGLMNQLMAGSSGTSGVDWAQATKIGESLLFSPLIGFSVAALLMLIAKALIPVPALFQEPKGSQPPPLLIRALLVLTCTGVSFTHGSNDVTVGERIGKTHLTYAQGASAELVAMVTIGAADMYGLPVSTTHVLSSGVAGTMVANRSGLQWATVRNLLAAWVLTLPVSIALAGGLYWLLRTLL